MDKPIKTLQDALTYQIQGLLQAERKVGEAFKTFSPYISSAEVKELTGAYVRNTDNVTCKLDRAFNYMMTEPVFRKNEIVDKMIDETEYLLTYTAPSYLKDIVMIGCLENINAYKASALQTAYLMAVELELDTVADLLQQILSWELVTSKQLTDLSIHEFNKLNDSVNVKGDLQ
jgi:ferritin-like metal-binding protein YciE